jgi:hypothetical protein
MRRAGGKGTGRLLLLLLCGIIIGTIVGHILSLYVDHPVFTHTVTMGTEGPFTLDLTVFAITLGFALNINFGTVLGVIIGLIFFFRS